MPQRVKECTQPALPKASRHGEPEAEDHHDHEPKKHVSGKPQEQDKRGKKHRKLEKLKKHEGEESSVKSGIEILGETVPKVGEIFIHPAANEGSPLSWVRGIQVHDTKACRFHFSSQGNVLDQMAADRVVSAQLFVGCPAEKEKLSIGGSQGSAAALHPVGEV